MLAWQTMQVFTLGSPAIGPVAALSWQNSVHVRPLATCALWGNSIGCTGRDITQKKSFTALPNVLCAGVKTVDGSTGELEERATSGDSQPTTPAVSAAHTTEVQNRPNLPARRVANLSTWCSRVPGCADR